MVIMMKSDVTESQIATVTAAVTNMGRKFKVYPGTDKDKKRPIVDAVMVFVYGVDSTIPRRLKGLEGVTKVFNIYFKTPDELL